MRHLKIARLKQNSKVLFQFRITLQMDEPEAWRVIQVPEEYTFWELHVAIQDAMDWHDCHLHEFRLEQRPIGQSVRFGIPFDDGEMTDPNLLPCWKANVGDHFRRPGDQMYYVYDFGDNWVHEVLLEGILLREKGAKLPRCIDGARATPPEDCGGPGGYAEILETLSNPEAEEYEDIVAWLSESCQDGQPFDPARFDIEKVKFTNPAKRLKKLLENL
jgi:hypothetical protein